MVKVRPRGEFWQIDIRFRWPDGTEYRERRNAPVSSKSGAQRWAQAREASLLSSGRPTPPVAPVAPLPTLSAFWPRVLTDHYAASRKKASTVDAVEAIFRLHLDPALGAKTLDQVTASDVAALKGVLADLAPKTVNNVLSVLGRLFRCAVEWGVIATGPRIGLLPVPPSSRDWYELPEYLRLVDGARKAGTGHLCLVLLGGSAGLRRGEIRALKWSNLDLARGQMTITRAFWRNAEASPKGGRSRVVPIGAELVAALKAHRHLGERVLTAEGVASNRTLRSWVQAAERRACLPVTGAVHVLRHTYCSHLAAAGVPAKAIQELAGHADLATTQRYMHLAPGDKAGAVDLLAAYRGTVAAIEKEKTG